MAKWFFLKSYVRILNENMTIPPELRDVIPNTYMVYPITFLLLKDDFGSILIIKLGKSSLRNYY